MRIVLIKNVCAAHLGLDPEMGLLYPKGCTLDACLPGVEEKLLREGFAIPETEWQQQQQAKQAEQAKAKHPHENKRGRGAKDNKTKA